MTSRRRATAGRLAGKVAIITGAGRGLGQDLALALAAEGARVVAAGRSLDRVQPTVAQVTDRGGTAIPVVCNVSRADDCERCVAETVDAFGTVDLLLNNANIAPLGKLLDVTDKSFELGFRIGPLATLRMMRACHPYLGGGGAIVNFGSGSSLRTDVDGLGAYAAVKEAIRVLTRAAAVEWGPDGIRVNAVIPLARTPSYVWWEEHDPEAAAGIVGEVPLGRLGDGETDIGPAVVFLCSDDSIVTVDQGPRRCGQAAATSAISVLGLDGVDDQANVTPIDNALVDKRAATSIRSSQGPRRADRAVRRGQRARSALISSSTGTGPGSRPSWAARWRLTKSPNSTRSRSWASVPSPSACTVWIGHDLVEQVGDQVEPAADLRVLVVVAQQDQAEHLPGQVAVLAPAADLVVAQLGDRRWRTPASWRSRCTATSSGRPPPRRARRRRR